MFLLPIVESYKARGNLASQAQILPMLSELLIAVTNRHKLPILSQSAKYLTESGNIK